MITIATSGGGTGGHVTPCIALFPDLKKRFDKIIHLGGDGMEKTLIPPTGVPLFTTKTIKFDRANPFNNFKIPFVLSSALKEAKEILTSENVDVVFGKGGYASLPSILAAKRLNIPVVIHESDFNMGLANRFASKFASLVLTSFPETKGGVFVGNPIRERIFHGDKITAVKRYGLDITKPTLLVFGGSSGSAAINALIFKTAITLTKRFNLVHIVGSNEKTRLFLPNYVALSYADDIEDLYALSDVIIMRGGANSLQEATALGKRVICIPLPKSKHSRGDQEDNALSYEKRGLITILKQTDATEKSLIALIDTVMNQKERPQDKSTPNGEIVKKIMELVKS